MTALSTVSLADEVATLLADLGVERQRFTGGKLAARTPISGETVAQIHETPPEASHKAIEAAHDAFLTWRNAGTTAR